MENGRQLRDRVPDLPSPCLGSPTGSAANEKPGFALEGRAGGRRTVTDRFEFVAAARSQPVVATAKIASRPSLTKSIMPALPHGENALGLIETDYRRVTRFRRRRGSKSRPSVEESDGATACQSPRNGKARRFDPAGFPCFGSEDPKHEIRLRSRANRTSPFLSATRPQSKKAVDKTTPLRRGTIGTTSRSKRCARGRGEECLCPKAHESSRLAC